MNEPFFSWLLGAQILGNAVFCARPTDDALEEANSSGDEIYKEGHGTARHLPDLGFVKIGALEEKFEAKW